MSELSWRVERVCHRAWPSLREETHGDWVFRFGAGLTKRANSVNPCGPTRADIAPVAETAAPLYACEHLPLLFRVPSMLPEIEQQLSARGFKPEGETTTLYLDLPPMPMRRDPDVVIRAAPDDAWRARMWALKEFGDKQRETHGAILGKLADPAAFMTLKIGGEMVALGFVVIHDRLLCIESLITDPAHRGKGHGRRLVGAMLAWGIEQGVEGACLQVTADNDVAIRLYRDMGFLRELYRYRYWRGA